MRVRTAVVSPRNEYLAVGNPHRERRKLLAVSICGGLSSGIVKFFFTTIVLTMFRAVI